ncbi:hypothetical protein STEG23_011475, partial [Scotinomys teguina]
MMLLSCCSSMSGQTKHLAADYLYLKMAYDCQCISRPYASSSQPTLHSHPQENKAFHEESHSVEERKIKKASKDVLIATASQLSGLNLISNHTTQSSHPKSISRTIFDFDSLQWIS